MNRDPQAEQGLFNQYLEDALAEHGGDAESDAALIQVWLTLGAEYLARAVGKGRTLTTLQGLRVHIDHARPSPPWKP